MVGKLARLDETRLRRCVACDHRAAMRRGPHLARHPSRELQEREVRRTLLSRFAGEEHKEAATDLSRLSSATLSLLERAGGRDSTTSEHFSRLCIL